MAQTRKPQYRVLAKALDELTMAVRVAYGPITDESGTLGDRMALLQRTLNSAEEVVSRAKAAAAEKARRKDAEHNNQL